MSEDDTKDAMTQEGQWLLVEEHYQSGKPLTARVLEATKGGLLVDIGGIHGIVERPVYFFYALDSDDKQQLSEEENLEWHLAHMKGQEMLLKVIEMDRANNHLVLTQQLFTDEEREAMRGHRERLLQDLRPGDVRRGVVTSLTRLAVRVDLEGVEGWIHRGHLLQHPVNDLSEIVQIGQEIEVMVLENDEGRVELSLVHAQLRDEVLRDVYPGQILVGYILSLSPEGVFVDLGGPLGLIPTDQVTRSYISHPADLFYRTQEVVVRIETIDIGKRVLLSLLEAH